MPQERKTFSRLRFRKKVNHEYVMTIIQRSESVQDADMLRMKSLTLPASLLFRYQDKEQDTNVEEQKSTLLKAKLSQNVRKENTL